MGSSIESRACSVHSAHEVADYMVTGLWSVSGWTLVLVQLFQGKYDLQKRSQPLVEKDRVAGLRGTEQLSVSLRLLTSGQDLEFMTQLHSAITALMFLMMQVEFLYVCCDFGAPCDCLASTNKHLTLLTDFRLRAS